MSTIKWFDRITGDETVNAVANRAGIGQTTLDRQVKRGVLSPEVIVAVARAYDADAIEGLMLSGLITEQDVKRHGAATLLSEISDRQLSDEVYERMIEGRGVKDFTETNRRPPVLEVISGEDADRMAALQTDYDIEAEIEGHLDIP